MFLCVFKRYLRDSFDPLTKILSPSTIAPLFTCNKISVKDEPLRKTIERWRSAERT